MFCWRLWVLESVCCLWDRVWGSHLSHPIVCFCCCCLSKSEGLDIELTTLKPSRGSVCRSLYLPDFLCVLIHLCLSLPPFLLVFCVCIYTYPALSVSSSLPFHPSLFFIVRIQPHVQKEKFVFNNKCYIHLWKHTSKKTSLCSCVCICMLDAGAMCT